VPGVSSKTALLCLERICASDGVGAPNTAIDVDGNAEDRVLPIESLIALVRKSGYQLQPATFDWRALLAASTTKTVLVVLRNSNVVLILGSGRDNEEVVASDPFYRNGEPFFLPRLHLDHAWGGQVLVLKPKRNKVDRTLTWCLSILSVCGLSAGLLLVSQAAVDGTLAGSHPQHRATAVAVSSNRSESGSPSNNAGPTAAATNMDMRPSNVSELTEPSTVTSLIALRDVGEAAFAAEAQKTEQPGIGVTPGSEASAGAVPSNAQEPSREFGESGARSEQSSAGGAPQTFTPAAPAPPLQTDAVSAKTAGLSLSPDEVAALLARGDALITKGDIASARLFYERAAEAADGQAALRLAEAYDPAFLARAHLGGVRGDPLVAARWYRRARELGVSEAEILLQALAPGKDQ
jgi:hypothetical protein